MVWQGQVELGHCSLCHDNWTLPHEESTIEAMYCLITTTMCPIPNHFTKPCSIILVGLLTAYVWFRLTTSLLVERPWLGHIEEHVTPTDKEILPKVVEEMCYIGYTCKQVVSTLKHPQSNNKTDPMNIMKLKLSSGDSSLPNIIPSNLPDPMKRRRSKSALLIRCRSNARLHSYSCPEGMHSSGNRVPEEDSLTANIIIPTTGDNAFNVNPVDSLSDNKVSEDSLTTKTINPATADNAFNGNSVDSLSDNFSAPESPRNGKCTGFVNMALTEENNPQSQTRPKSSPRLYPQTLEPGHSGAGS